MPTLDRRQFVGGALGAGAVAGLAGLGIPGLGGGLGPLEELIGQATASASGAPGPLVLATLNGGNDGLNTVIPYDTGIYHDWRGGLAIGADRALPIGNADGIDFGFHPSMTAMQRLFQAGQVAVILGVEYPNPNFSHFASMTIWQTADLSGDAGPGWIGRWLDRTGSDPLRALSIGPTLPQALVGEVQQASSVSDSTSGGSQQVGGSPQFIGAYRDLMSPFRRETGLARATASAGRNLLSVSAAATAALDAENPPRATDRDSGDLGTQLDVVAELISYGLSTRVYAVNYGSFDTHSDQAGTHAGLLGQVDAAVENFMAPFTGGGAQSPVLVLTSEFGRTTKANGSGGTDHSSANVVLVVGPNVRGGFYGAMPSFTRLDQWGNFIYTTDFRSVYTTVLENVLGMPGPDILGGRFPNLGFV